MHVDELGVDGQHWRHESEQWATSPPGRAGRTKSFPSTRTTATACVRERERERWEMGAADGTEFASSPRDSAGSL